MIFTAPGKFTSAPLLLAAVLLSSCTVGPDYSRPPVKRRPLIRKLWEPKLRRSMMYLA